MEFAIQVAGGQVRREKTGIEAILEEARLAESVGFDSVYVPDHYIFERIGVLQPEQPTYELFFVMGALAQATKKLRIGSQVACMLFRHPAMTARLFAQIDEASGGRVIAGVGAGWTKAEFDMFGLPFPEISERLDIMDEAVQVMRRLWGGETLSHQGKYFRTRDAVVRPLPVQRPGPPIMLGGSGKGILRRAARWADIIHMTPAIGGHGTTTMPAVAEFNDSAVTSKLEFLRMEAVKAGRAPGTIRYATTIYNYAPTGSPEQTRKLAEQIAPVFGLSPGDFMRHPLVLAGTPEEMAEEIQRRMSMHRLSTIAVNFSSLEQIRDFGEKVVARFAR